MIIKSSASERPYFFLRIAEHCDKSKTDASVLVGLTPLNNLLNFSNSNLTEDNSIVILFPTIILLSGRLNIFPLPK